MFAFSLSFSSYSVIMIMQCNTETTIDTDNLRTRIYVSLVNMQPFIIGHVKHCGPSICQSVLFLMRVLRQSHVELQ